MTGFQPTPTTTPVHLKVDAMGRVLIPAVTREIFGLTKGSEVLMLADDTGIHLKTTRQITHEIQAYCKAFARPNQSIVDELFEERKREADMENRGE
jgi:bifunctional DNA-binding transcriptional regulator/antitoxin component of YhaV-PrlF toxin-antitoxin module